MLKRYSFYAKLALAALCAWMAFTSCASAQAVVSDELSAAELVQKAQEASDRNRYKLATQYYEQILDRFPTDGDMACTAQYEISFIKYKQNNLAEAEAGLRDLLARYDSAGSEFLPEKFKILSNIVLEKIEAKKKNG